MAHDEVKSKKIKADWSNYMDLLEAQSMAAFLSLEHSSAEKRDSYEQQAQEEKKQYELIENAFAASMGNDAIKELQQIKQRKYDAFDRSGKNIAPIGYHYFPTSFTPYTEELVVDK
jgi:hypothetical protein